MIGITSTGRGKGLNKSLKTALNPTFQPPTCQALAGQARSRQALSEHPVLAGARCSYIYKYSCTLHQPEIYTENQHFTLLVKPLVQHRFLHRLLLLCFSCNPVIPKNKKSPETFPFFGQNPYICISSKSKAKQCSETRTATKSLPATELSTL